MATLEPLARLIKAELAEKLDGDVRLRFDSYGRDQVSRDQVSRDQVFAKLAAAEGVSPQLALALAGLAEND